jgi:hypothetical protein
MRYRILSVIFAFLLAGWYAPAQAQAVCDTSAAPTTSVCGPSNHLFMTLPTTNSDGSPLNDYASIEVTFGPVAGVCGATAGTTVKSLGALGGGPTPSPNQTVSALLSLIGLPNNKVFLAARAVDFIGNKSGCSSEIQFTFDNGPPNIPTSTRVGP